jgi:riboflavin kinase / FMN adenylyltransferase
MLGQMPDRYDTPERATERGGSARTTAGRMAVVPGIGALEADDGPLFVVVGVFDGLHLGHEYLLHELRRAARRHDARAAVVTFDHHPDEILVGAAPPLLCDADERLRLLAGAGVDVTVVQHFDERLRNTPFDDFIDSIAARSSIAGFLMTPDAAFGHDRAGTPARVAELGAERGFEVEVVRPFALDGAPVRSSDIRAAIATGDLATARRLLGRAVAVVGLAAADGNGAAVSFPLPVALPPDGEYPVSAGLAGSRRSRASARIKGGRLWLDRPFAGRVHVSFD